MSRYGWIRRSLMNFQMIRVISSPSSSTTGPTTLIFAMRGCSCAWGVHVPATKITRHQETLASVCPVRPRAPHDRPVRTRACGTGPARSSPAEPVPRAVVQCFRRATDEEAALTIARSFASLAYDSAAFSLVTIWGGSRNAGTALTSFSYDLVSLTSGVLPLLRSVAIWTAALTRLRVSLLIVEYCSPAMIDLTDSTSES